VPRVLRSREVAAGAITHQGDVERMLAGYRDRIGRAATELPTPSLVLDRRALARNIAEVERRLAGTARLRPHAKTHKSPEIARLQLEAGAIGVSVATAWEALALARAGIEDLLVANEVWGSDRYEALVEAASRTSLTVAVDDADNATELARVARSSDVELGVLIDVDVGLGRCGVRRPLDAAALALTVAGLAGLRLRGVQGYEGRIALDPDPERRARGAEAANDRRRAAVDAIEAAGLPVEVVSGGATGTWDLTARAGAVTELQAGSYVFMDTMHLAVVPDLEVSLVVHATVISRSGDTVVLDCGRKALGRAEPVAPRVEELPGELRLLSEEHLVIQSSEPATVGSTVRVVTTYAPAAVTMHEIYHVVDEGVVVDIWPVLVRGAGREGAR
jgi:D-serine deaminase-like pyridoxal phosphate-dependent protein